MPRPRVTTPPEQLVPFGYRPKTFAKLVGVSEHTLQLMRDQGRGFPFVRVPDSNIVLYPHEANLEYLRLHTQQVQR
jgi:hypothetical protein